MSRLKVLRCLHPARVWQGIARRGVRGALFHSLRKGGAVIDRALVGPYLIRINPMGAVCNHRCPMCWLQHLEPETYKQNQINDRELGMKLADYVRMLDAMPPGLQEVNIVGGGEPLIHPDIVPIMREIKKRGLYGSLITNGSLLKEPVARAMLEMGWDNTRVSVHAADPATYQAIQGVDHFETTKRNLATFTRLRREMGLPEGRCTLTIFNVIQRDNIPTLERLFEFAREVGADDIVFEKIIPYSQDKWLTADEIATAREKLLAGAAACPVPFNEADVMGSLQAEETCAKDNKPFRPAARCSVGFDQAFITSMGEVMPCCFATECMGSLREQSFSQIWWGPKYRNFRSRLINGRFADYCINNRCAMKGVLHD